jgi:phospholipid transport system substrate-binding protein
MCVNKFLPAAVLFVAIAAGAWPKEAAESTTTTAAKEAPTKKSPPKEPVVIIEEAATKNAQAKEPVAIVRQTVIKVLRVIADPAYQDSSQKKKMREKIRSMLLEIVDMKAVSVLTLANYRSKFSNEQFEKCSELFSRLLFSTYITHLEKYSDEKVLITGAESLSDTRIVVKTNTVSSTKQIPIDFSFTREDKKWMLYDVHIEGVGLVRNYRSQFREILLNKSADQFIERLRSKVDENENKL